MTLVVELLPETFHESVALKTLLIAFTGKKVFSACFLPYFPFSIKRKHLQNNTSKWGGRLSSDPKYVVWLPCPFGFQGNFGLAPKSCNTLHASWTNTIHRFCAISTAGSTVSAGWTPMGTRHLEQSFLVASIHASVGTLTFGQALRTSCCSSGGTAYTFGLSQRSMLPPTCGVLHFT